MANQKSSDEIDLLELFLKGVNTFRANFWLIVTFFLLGSALGLAYFLSSNKIYESKMIITSAILTESYSKILFENANRRVKERDIEHLAKMYNISEASANRIASLRIENLNNAEADDPKEFDHFLITVEVTDQKILPELQTGLIGYLENNEFVKIRVEQKKSFLNEMLASVKKEISDMEEFKGKIFNGDFFQRNNGNVMFDPTTVNSKILELTQRKIQYENELQLSNSVHVVDGFTEFQKQTRPRLSLSLVAGSFVGLFFVGALIAFKSLRKLWQLADEVKTS